MQSMHTLGSSAAGVHSAQCAQRGAGMLQRHAARAPRSQAACRLPAPCCRPTPKAVVRSTAAAGAEGQLAELLKGTLGVDSTSLRLPTSHVEDVRPALELLLSITKGAVQRVRPLVLAHPELLLAPLDGWSAFLSTYGVT